MGGARGRSGSGGGHGIGQGTAGCWEPAVDRGWGQPTLADGTDYVHVGKTIQDSPIWVHPDIVSASIPEDIRRVIPDPEDIRRGI